MIEALYKEAELQSRNIFCLLKGLESGHGFRHEFSTIMNENEWPADAIEVQLAHANGGSVRGIYNHAQYLDKRREMMQWWADWLDGKEG